MSDLELERLRRDLEQVQMPQWLRDRSLQELHKLALVTTYLLENTSFPQACRYVSKDNNGYNKEFRKFIDDVSAVIGTGLLEREGKAIRLTKNEEKRRKLQQVVRSILVAGRQVELANVTLSDIRSEVHVGGMISVINYLLLAAAERLLAESSDTGDSPPVLSLYQGEFETHLYELLAGNLHFIVNSNVGTHIPGFVMKEPLNLRAAELGILFRVKRKGERQEYHPPLVDGIRSRAKSLFENLLRCAISMINWRVQRTIRSDAAEIGRYLEGEGHRRESVSGNGSGRSLGPRIYVPTLRTARVLALRGATVALGHRPMHLLTKGGPKWRHRLEALGGCIGVDPDFPQSLMAYLPLTVFPDFPPLQSTEFFLYYLQKDGNPDPDFVSESAQRVMRKVRELVSSNKRDIAHFIYESDGESERLVHDFSSAASLGEKPRKVVRQKKNQRNNGNEGR